MSTTMSTATARLSESATIRAHRIAQAKKFLRGLLITTVGLVIIIVVAFPNLWLLDTSFKTNDESWLSPPHYLPFNPTLASYGYLFGGVDASGQSRELQFWYVYFINSVIVSVIPAVVATAISTLAGYGFARFRFPGATFFLTLLLVGQMFPGPSLFVPIYFLVNTLGLYDNLLALIIIYTAFHIPVGTWLSNGFIRSIPLELEDSARIDGCNLIQTLVYIALPLAKIGILTVALLGFMAFWGEFGFASIILEDRFKYTATLAMMRQITETTSTFTVIGAAATLMGLPLLLFLLFAQKSFVRGLAAGALKES
jgi:ABC-type glycerol-3-phosphate transport system permease component